MPDYHFKEPLRPLKLPKHSQWLAGLDSGQWFVIDDHDPENRLYRIRSFNSKAQQQFDRIYMCDKNGFQINKSYQFTHLSQGQYCSISQNKKLFRFTLLSQDESLDIHLGSSEIKNN